MIKIKSVAVPFGMGAATKLNVQVNPFSTSDKTCTLYYSLYSNEGKMVHDGNQALSEAEFAAWGESNEFLENIVLEKLNLERDENN